MDYIALVKEKEQEVLQLDKRMQQDSDLLYLAPYILSDTNNRKVPDIVNVTLNKPAVFAANVISSLGGTSEQTVVSSDKKSLDCTYIEEFQEACYNMANDRLRRSGQSLLNPFADTQLCIRGRTARRVCFRMEDDILIPEITPWDGRYTFYEMGNNGLVWAAYKTERSKYQVESEYNITIKGKTATVIDVWDEEHNEVWIDGKKEVDQGHEYGYCPVVVSVVDLGYGNILLDKNRIKNEGESIFFLIRGIVPELNRLISILQTLNMKAVKPPMQYKSKGGAEATPPEYEDATDMGTIISTDPEGGVMPIDYGDAKQSAQMMYGILEKQLEEGSISSVDLGNLTFPLSAVAMVKAGEGRDQVYIPRLQAKAILNQLTAEMFTKQVLDIGGGIELGTPGHKRTFNTKRLEGEYETTYKYYSKSPSTDIARMAVAAQSEKWYPRNYILSDVLQVENPDEIEQEWYQQQAEIVSPNILKHRIIMNDLKLAEEGDEDAAIEAQLLATELGLSIEQIRLGIQQKNMQDMNQQTTQQNNLPLFGSSRGGSKGPSVYSPEKRLATLPEANAGVF